MDSVSTNQLNRGIHLHGPSRQLQTFTSIPQSSSEQFQRERRRLKEDRRVNDQRTNPFQNSPNQRIPLASVNIPLQPSSKNPLLASNNENSIRGFRRPDDSFGDRQATFSHNDSGQRVGSSRPSTSYTNLSPSDNRLPSLRTGRRLEQDRKVNSKTENTFGSTRSPTNTLRNEDTASRSQVGVGSLNQEGINDDARARNQDQSNRSNQVETNPVPDQSIKRPSINYRTLLDNDLRSSRKNQLFQKGKFVVPDCFEESGFLVKLL